MIAIDLSKHQAIDADSKAIQQMNCAGSVERDKEKEKEKNKEKKPFQNFFQETVVKVL